MTLRGPCCRVSSVPVSCVHNYNYTRPVLHTCQLVPVVLRGLGCFGRVEELGHQLNALQDLREGRHLAQELGYLVCHGV